MSIFSVDENKCTGDGLCVAECPVKIIEIKGDSKVPTPTDEAEEYCIDCGHCVAICPHGALSHRSMSPDDCMEGEKKPVLSPVEAEKFLRQRRSVRNYKDSPVDKHTIEELIRIASYAPSGHNTQPVSWKVLYEQSDLKKILTHIVDWMKYMIKEQPDFAKALHLDRIVRDYEKGNDTILRGAPHVILAHADKNNPMGQAAATIALSHLEITVPSFNLGACWAGYLHVAAIYWPPLLKELNFPENHVCHGAILVGHPKYKYSRYPARKKPEISWG